MKGKRLPQDPLCGFGSQYPFATQAPMPLLRAYTSKTKATPERLLRGSTQLGVSVPKSSPVGKPLRLQSAKAEKTLRRIPKEPPSQGRFLGAAFFPGVSLQKQRNPEKIFTNDLAKPHSNTIVSQTNFNTPTSSSDTLPYTRLQQLQPPPAFRQQPPCRRHRRPRGQDQSHNPPS